jgi:serine/threonine-protein kinase HipA
LGLEQDRDFRISVAGAQEKTALLWYEGQWLRPRGITPTTHLFKTQIGALPNGLDLSNSVENEYYCLKLLEAFGLPVAAAEIRVFGESKALVVRRFDRQWTKAGSPLRLPQEDCCQALSVPPGRKYQSDGGPGMTDVLRLLARSDSPAKDQKHFLKAQMLFWLIGATDGHAKNFSVYLGPGGNFWMTPLYDVLTAQPSVDAHQIQQRQMKLAMSVGVNRHYRLDMIEVRHFLQTAERAGVAGSLVEEAFAEIVSAAASAFADIEQQLPPGFPEQLHLSVKGGFFGRSREAVG